MYFSLRRALTSSIESLPALQGTQGSPHCANLWNRLRAHNLCTGGRERISSPTCEIEVHRAQDRGALAVAVSLGENASVTPHSTRHYKAGFPLIQSLEKRTFLSAAFYVSLQGNDAFTGSDPAHPWRHIQKAFDSATPGSVVTVEAGRYLEKDILHVSGNALAGAITFQAQGHVIVDGTGRAGANIFDLSNQHDIKLLGFDITNNLNVHDGSGIRIEGSGSNILLANNIIHHIRGSDAMAITIYGESATSAISNLMISNNTIYDCQPAQSEASPWMATSRISK